MEIIFFFIIIVCLPMLAFYVSRNADNLRNTESKPDIHYTNSAAKSSSDPEVIVCKNCGASNPTSSTDCEYCGSRLKRIISK